MYFLIWQNLVLLLVAMLVGFVAGWIFFGGRSARIAEVEENQRVAENELSQASELLVAREADVARLRGKLRLAATELEKRATQVAAARRAFGDVTGRLNDSIAEHASTEAERLRLSQLAEEAINNPTLWAGEADLRRVEAEVAERMKAVTAELDERALDLERAQSELAESDRRASDAEDRRIDALEQVDRMVVRADSAEAEALRVRNESEQSQKSFADRISELELDLSSNRLRSESVRNEISAIAAEIDDFRERNTASLQDAHTRLVDLRSRVETARTILSGASAKSTGGGPGGSSADLMAAGGKGADELVTLPGMNEQIHSHLQELGVRSLADVAGWSETDVHQYSDWLSDHPNVIRDNDWVGYARRLITERAETRETVAAVSVGETVSPAD